MYVLRYHAFLRYIYLYKAYIIKLSEVYVQIQVLSCSFYVVMFILLNFYQSRCVLETITNVGAVVYQVLDQLR